MIVTLSSILFWLCILSVLATVVISFLNRKDYRLLSKILPFYGVIIAVILAIKKKNPKITRILMHGVFWGLFYWFFIYDWLKIMRPWFFDWIDYVLISLNPFVLGYIGLSQQFSSTPSIMGVFWNPTILIFISIGLIILFGIYRLMMKLVYEGIPLLIKILIFITSFVFLSLCPPITNFLSLIFSEEFIFISPYLFISNGNIIDAMFLYLIELLGISYVGIRISWWRNLIIKGWKYIMKILIIIACLVIVSIYPFLFSNNPTDILFAYLYELWFLSIWCLILSVIFAFILRIIKNGWKYIKKVLITVGACIVIVLLSYLLADGSIDPQSLKYGITETKSKFVGTGMILVAVTVMGLILPGIIVLEFRKLVFKSS